MKNPIVSISCITFNHALFLKECFEGFLMQKTNFDFEIIVHDDASTDGTIDIINEYQKKYPKIFFPFIQNENQYSQGVRGIMARYNFPRCRGKYIALCEGDDYWTDPNKLQKQVDFLEKNNDYSLVAHNAKIKYSNEFRREMCYANNDLETIEDVSHYFYYTCSMVFRNDIFKDNIFNQIEFNYSGGDKLIMFNAFKKGKLKYLDDTMSVYRKHIGGVSFEKKTNMGEIENNILLYHFLKKYFHRTYNGYFNKLILVNYSTLITFKKLNAKSYFKNILESLFFVRSFNSFKLFLKEIILSK